MDPAELSYHAERRGTIAHFLVWVNARNRTTGAIESIGLWTGDDDQAFVVGGQSRSYFGANNILAIDNIAGEIGLNVRMLTIEVAITPEAEQLVRGYDPGLQAIEVHRVVFNLDTRQAVANPERVFFGTVDQTPIESAQEGGAGSIKLVCASVARSLTRTLPIYRSDAALRAREPSDRFRKYTADAQLWRVPWGQETL